MVEMMKNQNNTNYIDFEVVVHKTKNNCFCPPMISFIYLLEFNDHIFHTNETVIDYNYKCRLLFTKRECFSFGTDIQSLFYTSNRFLKNNIDGVCVPQFQRDYICDTTHTLHKILKSCAVI